MSAGLEQRTTAGMPCMRRAWVVLIMKGDGVDVHLLKDHAWSVRRALYLEDPRFESKAGTGH